MQASSKGAKNFSGTFNEIKKNKTKPSSELGGC